MEIGMKRAFILCILLATLPSLGAGPSDRSISFVGEVSEGQTFRKSIGHGLDFVLTPSDSGWTIEVSPHDKPTDRECDDFLWVVTPPYHFQNVRYLDTEYGTTAQEAVKVSPREFHFVLNCADLKTESKRVELVIYPSNASKEAVDEAGAKLGSSPSGEGRLWIKDSKISPGKKTPDNDDLGLIHWIKFRVEIKFPAKRPMNPSP